MTTTYPEGLVLDLTYEGAQYVHATPALLAAWGVPEEAILIAFKSQLKSSIDQGAEAARARMVTQGVGQSMEYQEVLAQAQAADKAKSTATAERYPMLATTIGIDKDPQTGELATDILAVSRCILATSEAWKAYATEIRGTRLSAKQAIDAAETSHAAQAVFDAVAWPVPPG